MEKTIITGYISNYIYTSEDSLYKVCELTLETDDPIIIVGNFPRLEEGLNYEFVGEFKKHSKYGEQFFVESYAKSKSFTKAGLIQYLSSDRFYGIGEKTAENIVKELGLDCINIILDNPDSLSKIKGITKPKAQALVEVLKESYASEQVFIRLYGFGLTNKMVKKLYDAYGNNAANKIEENPYFLIDEVEGFGFKKSDSLALNLGFKEDDIRRIKASILYTLNFVCYQQGFTFLTDEQLLNSAKKLLNDNPLISEQVFLDALKMLEEENKIIKENDKYYDSYLYKCEEKVADKLLKISKDKSPYKEEKVKKSLEYIESLISIRYTPLQKDAIINALSSKLSIITGGPGTGKSTILNGILMTYANMNNLSIGSDELDYKVTLVAPTGRAAKRMTETTNMKATTIHKALGYNYTGEFCHSENNPLMCSLLIIDEASMLDISIASSLFSSLSNRCQIILVGDANQLPSVGPGNLLADLISTSIFKTTRLNQIMRQANDSNIIALSHMILNEKIDYSIFSRKKDLFFYNYDAKDIIEGIYKILDNFIASGGNLHTQIQILVPMYAGVAGIDAINLAIQERYNKEEEKILKRELKLFKKNDKVLQLKNDAELDIMNGDIGRILDIIKIEDKDAMLIDFDGRVVTYYASNLDNLSLAYAISIHKSQGSEFDNVIMPVIPSYFIMLKKKIIYTAATRAKKKLIVLGKMESIESAIHRMDYQRQTSLYQRIELDKPSDIIQIFDLDIPFDTLGEYDMDGITPYTFMDLK